MYWPERALKPAQKREVGFSYGLGEVASGDGDGRLLLSVGGRFVRGGAFTLMLLVRNPRPGERLTLALPDGFALAEGEAEQPVPAVRATLLVPSARSPGRSGPARRDASRWKFAPRPALPRNRP